MTNLQPHPEGREHRAQQIGCLALVGSGLIVIVLILLTFEII